MLVDIGVYERIGRELPGDTQGHGQDRYKPCAGAATISSPSHQWVKLDLRNHERAPESRPARFKEEDAESI